MLVTLAPYACSPRCMPAWNTVGRQSAAGKLPRGVLVARYVTSTRLRGSTRHGATPLPSDCVVGVPARVPLYDFYSTPLVIHIIDLSYFIVVACAMLPLPLASQTFN